MNHFLQFFLFAFACPFLAKIHITTTHISLILFFLSLCPALQPISWNSIVCRIDIFFSFFPTFNRLFLHLFVSHCSWHNSKCVYNCWFVLSLFSVLILFLVVFYMYVCCLVSYYVFGANVAVVAVCMCTVFVFGMLSLEIFYVVSFVNSNKLSIVLNMCYPHSSYIQYNKLT